MKMIKTFSLLEEKIKMAPKLFSEIKKKRQRQQEFTDT